MSTAVIVAFIAAIYLGALGVMTPVTYHVNYFSHKMETPSGAKRIDICIHKWEILDMFHYGVGWSVFAEFLPLSIILIAYLVMFHDIKRTNPNSQATSNPTQSNIRKLRLMKIQKKFTIIVATFFILTLPDCIAFLLIMSWYIDYKDELVERMKVISEIFYLMTVFNSSANPLIYGNWKNI